MTTSDHEAITAAVYRYAYGIDTRDWRLYRSIFAEQVEVDFSSYNDRPAATIEADDWVTGLKPLFTGLDATQHTMSNPLVEVDGHAARCRMYMQAAHFLTDWPQPEFTIGGYYDDRLVRSDDQWLLTAVTLTVWWRRGDEALMAEAARRGRKQLEAET